MSCPVSSKSETEQKVPHSLPRVQEQVPIPQPPEYLFGLLGNLPEIDPSFPQKSFWRLSELYGPIVKLNLRSPVVLVSNQKLVNEICDEERFEKRPSATLVSVRALTGDGLFTAFPEEKNWWKAHRLLVPAFGPLGIRAMFGDMLDISSQLVLRWDRLGPEHMIECSDDFTRLAFDTIGLCAFGYRFNEFYSDKAHPFAQQMGDFLLESGRRTNRTNIQNQFYYASEEQRQENVRKMHQLCDEIIKDRHRNPQPDAKDLLSTMLNGVDRETGEKLSDENIRYNMCTFLVAGHETTSATLSFCYYNLLKNPEKLLKAQQQVDEIVGTAPLELQHLSKLTYIDACIKETLRMTSPIGAFVVHPKEDTLIGGKYFVAKDTFIQANLRGLHYDRDVWGDDVSEFKPERMLDGGFQALPPNSWKPFGNGMRACIGRAFAEQEMIMNVALVLQRFQLELADPTYELKLKSTMTIKPYEFRMKVHRRAGRNLMTGLPGGSLPSTSAQSAASSVEKSNASMSHKLSPLTVYFGGNTGTCEGFAQNLETKASEYGFEVKVKNLDSATEALPTNHPVVIITASYEGKPPDNAKKFVTWLDHCDKESKHLKDVKYAVFGVGNSDWASTFHRIPKLVDSEMASFGASRLLDAGYTNAKTDLLGPWEDWMEKLWKTLRKSSGTTSEVESTPISVTVQSNNTNQASAEMNVGIVLVNNELAGTKVGLAKRHMEVRLPEGTEYIAGDYLVVLPRNPQEVVRRILTRFGLVENDIITITGSKKKFLPTDPISAEEFLSTVVELSTPITKRQLEKVATYAKDTQQEAIAKFTEEGSYQKLIDSRYSIIDFLDEHNIQMPFGAYIDMLQPLAPRQYSISSSPLKDYTIASVTYDVLELPAWSGQGTFYGVASAFLASRKPGDRISCFVRKTNVGFRLPVDYKKPVIMIAAGTGIAPMRAFIQERAAIVEAGVHELGPAVLFFGCRDNNEDFIYKKELKDWEAKGVVQVMPAFSKMDSGSKYVQDAVWENRDMAADMFKNDGKIYLCGSAAKLGKSAADVLKKIYIEKKECSEKEAEEWLEAQKEDRYISDVYG